MFQVLVMRDSCWKLRKCGEHFNQIMFLYVVDSINFMDFGYADELDASEYKQALRDNSKRRRALVLPFLKKTTGSMFVA